MDAPAHGKRLFLLLAGVLALASSGAGALSLREAQLVVPSGPLPAALALSRDEAGLTLKNGGKDPLVVTVAPSQPFSVDDRAGTISVIARASFDDGFALEAIDASGVSLSYPLRVMRRDPRGFLSLDTFRLDRPPNEGFAAGTPFFVGPPVPFPLRVAGIRLKIPPSGTVTLAALQGDPTPRRFGKPRWEVVNTAPFDNSSWFVTGKTYRNFGGEGVPQLSAAAVVPGPGRYEIGLTVRDAWQGPVVAERRVAVEVSEAAWLQSTTPAIDLPIGKPGSYWIEARVWDAADATTRRQVRQGGFLVHTDVTAPVPPAAGGGGPARLLSWSAPGGAVWKAGESGGVTFTVGGAGRLDVTLRASNGEIVAEDHQAVTESGRQVLFSKIPPVPGAYFIEAALSDDQGLLDRCGVVAGRRGAPVVGAPSGDPAPYPDGVVATEFLLPTRLKGVSAEARLSRIDRGIRAAAAKGLRVVELEFPWGEVEPMPDVYDFALIDQCLKSAGQAGVTVNLSVWYLADHRPPWLASEIDRDAEGLWTSDRLCLSSPRYREAFSGLWKTIAERYRGDRRVSGYLVTAPGLDWVISDNWPWPHREYAPAAEAAFRDYLRVDRHLDLAALSERYHRRIDTWSGVALPVAEYGAPADLRPEWRDYIDFRVREVGSWLEGVLGTIRQADPVRPIWVYQYHGVGPHEAYFPIYQRYHARPTSGADEEEHYQSFVSRYSLWGLSSRGEPNPAQGTRNVDLGSGFFALLSGGPLAANYSVEWHGAFPDLWEEYDRLPASERNLLDPYWMNRVRQTALYDKLQVWSRVLPRLAGSALPPASGRPAVLFADAVGLYRERSFTTYQAMGGKISHYFNDVEHLAPQWVSDHTPGALYRENPFLIVDGEAFCLHAAAVAEIGNYVRQGGIVVTTPFAGRWLDDRETESGAYLQALGFGGADKLTPQSSGEEVRLGAAVLRFVRRAIISLPPDAVTLATFADGSPAVVRRPMERGAVLLFLGEIDWPASHGLVDYLSGLRPLERWAEISSSKIRIVALQQERVRRIFATYYLALPARNQEGLSEETARLRVPGLPDDGGGYKVTEELGEKEIGVYTAAQLRDGFSITLSAGDSAVYKVEPEKGPGSP